MQPAQMAGLPSRAADRADVTPKTHEPVGSFGEVIAWALACLGCLALWSAEVVGGDEPVVIGGVLTSLVGLRIFWLHGRERVTAAGSVSLASVVFVGVSAIAWARLPGELTDGYFASVAGTLVALLVMWALFWRTSEPLKITRDRATSTGPLLLTGLTAIGIALATMMATGGPQQEGAVSASVPAQVIVGGFSLVIVAILAHRSSSRATLVRMLLVLGVVAVFTQALFSGYGRLNIVALGMAAAIVATNSGWGRWIKSLMIVGIWPAVVILAVMRESFFEKTYGSAGSVEFGGAASIFTPLRDCARLYELVTSSALTPEYGSTFWAAATFWIPRAIWDDKPVGLGAQLNEVFNPQNQVVGQSYAALLQGEFWLNFRVWGLVPLIIVVGVFVRYLDRVLMRSFQSNDLGLVQLLKMSIIVIAVADLPNLIWGGTFAYVSRVGLRVSVPLAVLLVVWAIGSRRNPPSSPVPN